ncbi:iron ABC transporter [Collibacillus ludicampi]|jgi:iron complex transport system substrate-binding protein|uniref:Iron ABC transporter n=1 Tax=Collibacillus ludicampi TaxID=2771369 RepID=A0AAV4LK22_9BACL|nr:helical backbone metal receptor [Collibacillus ludicampi]GIM48111.1 iron ABC transporter [Collibacillus ludicampi]
MKKIFKDHLQRTIEFEFPPRRIVSLCPSITETLFALDLEEQIVGKTRYCIHPEDKVKQVTNVGGTKKIQEDLIRTLNPDLIIAEKEENTKEMVESLSRDFPVFVADVENYAGALRLIRDLGFLTNREEKARHYVEEIEEQFKNMPKVRDCKVAYLIWKKPFMVAGNHTYIHSILETCGFTNVFRDYEGRYPSVTEDDLKQAAPDFLFLPSEPFPFTDSHKDELQQLFPEMKVILVDGEIFSWYGVRMMKVPSYINQLLREMRM